MDWGFADIAYQARPLSNGKIYPSKLISGFVNSQATQRTTVNESKREGQAIDPLSHVCNVSSLKDTMTPTEFPFTGNLQAYKYLDNPTSKDACD